MLERYQRAIAFCVERGRGALDAAGVAEFAEREIARLSRPAVDAGVSEALIEGSALEAIERLEATLQPTLVGMTENDFRRKQIEADIYRIRAALSARGDQAGEAK